MTITITRQQPASRRARSVGFAALTALAAGVLGYWGVQAIDDQPDAAVTTPADAGVSAQLADWARTNGVSGLSPASATAGPDGSAQVADWARANGLSGLSPASAAATP